MENEKDVCIECRGREITLNVYSTIVAEATEDKANRRKTHAGASVRGLMSKRKN